MLVDLIGLTDSDTDIETDGLCESDILCEGNTDSLALVDKLGFIDSDTAIETDGLSEADILIDVVNDSVALKLCDIIGLIDSVTLTDKECEAVLLIPIDSALLLFI